MAVGPIGPANLFPVGESLSGATQAPADKGSFTNLIDRLLGDASTKQAQADQAVRDLALGKVNDFHTVMLATAKADLSFRMVLEIRNRLTDAYQEIMRMQV